MTDRAPKPRSEQEIRADLELFSINGDGYNFARRRESAEWRLVNDVAPLLAALTEARAEAEREHDRAEMWKNEDRITRADVRAALAAAEARLAELREALAFLVRLKDGPRDGYYELHKPRAWDAARAALAAPTSPQPLKSEENPWRPTGLCECGHLFGSHITGSHEGACMDCACIGWAAAATPAAVDHHNDVPPHQHGGTDAPECTTCRAAAFDAARDALTAVEALHQPVDEYPNAWCKNDGQNWPCSTIRALSPAAAAGPEGSEQ